MRDYDFTTFDKFKFGFGLHLFCMCGCECGCVSGYMCNFDLGVSLSGYFDVLVI